LGTTHSELYLNDRDAIGIIYQIPYIYDEPFGDSSALATIAVSKLAAGSVKVVLTGDGGDELFGGYNRHIIANGKFKNVLRFPKLIRTITSNNIVKYSAIDIDKFFEQLYKILPGTYNYPNIGDKLHKVAKIIKEDNIDRDSLYRAFISQWSEDSLIDINLVNKHNCGQLLLPNTNFSGSDRMMFLDILTYLPGDILVKVDRATMANGLEARSPFLDERIINYALSLPISKKIKKGVGKLILRELLSNFIPKELIDSKKRGFAVPLDLWLRGPLRSWADELLRNKDLMHDSYLNQDVVLNIWSRHLSGENLQHIVWNILMYLSWRKAWL
jgi:asparagine synthase (glutamine-hydrolysing)